MVRHIEGGLFCSPLSFYPLLTIYNSTIGNIVRPYISLYIVGRAVQLSVWPVSSSGQLFRHLGSCGGQRTDANAPEEPFSQNIHRLSAKY